MANLGLLQHRSVDDLRTQEAIEAQRMADAEARRREVLESSLSSHIRKCWEDAKINRQEIELRLLDCLRRRKGEYDPTKLAAIRKEGGSAIYMNLTATKIRAGSAWIRDILMPVNENPWGLDPTPVAEIPPEYTAKMMQQMQGQQQEQAQGQGQQNGQQADPQQMKAKAEDQIRQMAQEKAAEAAERHEGVIKDQLAEGGWNYALESFVDDFATFPAAFIRAPILRRVPTLEWMEGWKAVKGETIRPEFERVSPFDLYPSPDATNIDDAAYIIERTRFTRAQLTQLIRVPSYNEESVRSVLEDYGQSGLRDWLWTDGERAELEGRGNEWLARGETIDGLIYSGGAQGTALLQWGVNPDDIEDPLGEYEVEAILIGNHIIRVKINRDPLERRPYHKASFQPVPGSFWGISIPELMSDIQDVCNATARSLVNNLAISSGPQVEVYEERLDPSEDPTDMYPWKVWRTKDGNTTGNNPAVRWFQPGSNANELLAVYEQFERRADDATNIPRYTYGNENVGGAGQTASGLSMLMESANKGIKDAIRHIDRGVIRRVIEALWLHNMQYSEDPSIKGDVNVVARGSSAMLMREQTAQLRQQFLAQTANELDMGIIGTEGRRSLLDAVAEKLDLPGLIPTKEQMEQQQAQQQKAGQAQRELAQAQAEADVAETQSKAQKYAADAAETQADAQHDQKMAPLEAEKLIAEIMNLLAKAQEETDGRDGMESTEPNRGLSGGRPIPGPAQATAGAMPGRPGMQPGTR